jgi:hypothetical protein
MAPEQFTALGHQGGGFAASGAGHDGKSLAEAVDNGRLFFVHALKSDLNLTIRKGMKSESPGNSLSLPVAFFMDERLSHDRKTEFGKRVTRLRTQYRFEILSSKMSEAEFLEHLKTHSYSLILMPWHQYLSWHKLEHHFGTLRLGGPTTVAGYFADALLPFELPELPSYHRLLLLDFYRPNPAEVETLLQSLLFADQKTGLRGLCPLTTPIHHQTWFEEDAARTRCIDLILDLPLFRSKRWADRSHQFRFFLTSLWSLAFNGHHPRKRSEVAAEIEIAENEKRIFVKYTATHPELTLKDSMNHWWPPRNHGHPAVNGLIRHSDFLRVTHFPESNQVEITAFFLESNPTILHPGEVRGFWIEPQKLKFLKSSAEQGFQKQFPVVGSHQARLEDQLQEVLDLLKAVHLQAEALSAEDRFILEHRCSNIRFLVDAIEKRALQNPVAAKKKIA